jgi:hypothetical protein
MLTIYFLCAKVYNRVINNKESVVEVNPSTSRRFLTPLIIIIALIGIVAAMLYVLNLSVTPGTAPQTTPLNSQPDETNTSTNQPANQPAVTTRRVYIAYIADGDDGKIGEKVGCGDSVVIVSKTAQATSDVEGALRALLADKSEKYGTTGLRNALWQSSLTLDGVTVIEKTANVKLGGNLQLAGVCDIPRVKAQLESTVKASSDATAVNITVNDKTLDEALSLK